MSGRSLTCKGCGWVYFGVSRRFAIEQTHSFAEYYNSLTEYQRKQWYGGRQISLLRNYARCRCGRPNTQFRDSTAAEIQRVYGCTVSSMIYPEEKVI